ncbi:MAG: small subunit ribosomal protein [Solirubrobacteraceae bacterium]|nr:small subunit ribosomal protein [Solirubrobacteraceae bacterium]
MMADDETPQTPPDADAPAEDAPQHAVPSEDAREIAGSAEDAALEAAEEAIDAGGEKPPEPATAQPAGEGHAVPTDDAQQIAGAAEDAALEAAQEAADATAVEAAVDEDEDEGDDADVAASGPKPSVPGAHLEVDIVPEGADPLGREQGYEDPYAVEEDGDEAAGAADGAEAEETLTEPIATAAIDLAAGARYRATGKRKTAIARVTLRPGKGTYLINGRTLEQHFPRDTLQRNIRQPLETVGYQDRMDVVARLHGGGISAQAGALRHGVSRALLEADPNLRGELKRRGFLTRDSRAKERKKAGLKKARKRPQFSKR